MPGNSSDGKHKRRPVGFQLTEDEINNFIAHGGDDEDSGESDWDDLGETNLSEVQYQKKTFQINTNPPKATSSSSTKLKVSERQGLLTNYSPPPEFFYVT
ncbi:hypothetical protein FGIG_04281 [Fasciola gigantica]|uniref:Uncharacterized protein n=1 Tax=Fasciola gigantica TaxID=46835 RepID=A0A504Z2L7_FASGI|nr:hypothetical protein FGIG_04281 [Fasciola gigantica]